MVSRVVDAVHKRVSEEHIRVGHIYLGSKHLFALFEFPLLHLLKESEVLLYASISVRTVCARGVYGASACPYLLLCLVVHIGKPLLNKFHSPIVELVEIVGGIKLICPLKSKPFYILFNGIYILYILLCWVGVVKTDVCSSSISLGQTKVKADALGVSYMQIPVRLRRESGLNLLYLSGLQVSLNYLFKEVEFALFCNFGLSLYLFHISLQAHY